MVCVMGAPVPYKTVEPIGMQFACRVVLLQGHRSMLRVRITWIGMYGNVVGLTPFSIYGSCFLVFVIKLI